MLKNSRSITVKDLNDLEKRLEISIEKKIEEKFEEKLEEKLAKYTNKIYNLIDAVLVEIQEMRDEHATTVQLLL